MRPTQLLWPLMIALATVCAVAVHAQAPTVVSSCDFEGPYSTGEQQVQEGCANNWQWGRKDMLLKADTNSGRPGTTQMIHVRGISSGGMQFFYTRLKLKKDQYYRISYWMKTDGLEGPMRCYVRKIGYPWTVYVWGGFEPISSPWQEYSFTGKCPEDVNDDVGVCWETGSLGAVWLDDLKVEESTSAFPARQAAATVEYKPGNILPRSSFEGRRDRLWSMGFFGWNRDGVWEGVEADWEDPQMYRAEGGKVGRYCMAVPSATHAGQGAALSTVFDLLPGKPYTVSLWMKASEDGFPGSCALQYWGCGRHLQPLPQAYVYPKLTTEWQRVSFTTTPEPPPGSTDLTTPVQAMLQLAPGATRKGIVFVDGLQLEAGDKASDYQPAYPLELYADVGQDGGNLIEWGQKVPLNLLLAAADQTPLKDTKVEVTVTGYPDKVVWKKTLGLAVNKETLFTLDLKRHGLFRVDMRPVDKQLAATQQMLFALVPPIRNTGEQGMFGTHIAIRPFLVSYIRRLGFTWTRLHDCSLLTKWSASEREPGKFLWHDEVVDGVRKGGINLLGLPDDEPEWAKVKQEGANPVNMEAYGKFCEEVARHYAGKIDYWELWNEPYMLSFGDHFGEVLTTGYPAIKRGNPNAKVVGWCADVTNPAWGAKLTEEARRNIDIFSFHNYPNNLCGGGTLPFAAELPDHRKQWPAHVTECWDTEGTNGALCANSMYPNLPSVSADQNDRAAAFASRVWVEHARAGASKFFVYQMHNTDTMAYHGGYQSLLIGYDRTPTPAAISTATTAYCIDGLKFVTERPVAGIVQGLFEGPDRRVWVVYDDGGIVGRKTLDLTKLPADVTLLDVMGNDPRQDGVKRWEIGFMPLFVLSGKLPVGKLEAACQKALLN